MNLPAAEAWHCGILRDGVGRLTLGTDGLHVRGEFFQKTRLARADFAPRDLEREPGGPVHFREFLPPAGAGRPLQAEDHEKSPFYLGRDES